MWRQTVVASPQIYNSHYSQRYFPGVYYFPAHYYAAEPPLYSKMGQYFSSSSSTHSIPPHVVPAVSQVRKMIPLSIDRSTPASSPPITVMSWNILAEMYASAQWHPQCPLDALHWPYRKRVIVDEIARHRPDFVCLQELDHFDEIQNSTVTLGYTGLNRPRIRTPFNTSDGCAIFYQSNKYRLVEQKDVLLDVAATTDLVTKNFTAPNDFIKNNVAIFAVFERVQPNKNPVSPPVAAKRFVVATTHLFWNPVQTQVKIVQAHFLLEELSKFLQERQIDAFVLTGDFNSLPGSGVYDYITKGRISNTHTDLTRFFPSFDRSHQLRLSSAYSSQGEPLTNFTLKFNGCLDYIFYCPSSLQLTGVLEKQAEDDPALLAYRAAPNPLMPSDHTLILAEFTLNSA